MLAEDAIKSAIKDWRSKKADRELFTSEQAMKDSAKKAERSV